LVQLATISIDLLISAPLESLAEPVGFQLQVNSARDRLNAEIADDLKAGVSRDDVVSCVQSNISGRTSTVLDLQSQLPAPRVPEVLSPKNRTRPN
jgi:hypothetical protein